MDPEKDVDESIVGEEGEEGDDEEDSDTDTEEDSKVCVRISVITFCERSLLYDVPCSY